MMMKSKFECGDKGEGGDVEANSDNGQLLREIEEISRALYFNKTLPKSSFASSHSRSKSAGKTRLPKPQVHFPNAEDPFRKEKKLSSSWNWKKPLKALTHIGHQKFDCCFNLHVHSIEGLPTNFNGISLRVHWKRKSSSSMTNPSRVFLGAAEFDETLTRSCSVYGSRIGTSYSVKYESRRILIYASIVGAPEHDIGHHQVDLTRLLPLTLEELRGDKSSGKWTTSFKLVGKALGASLNVSFSYQVLKDELMELGGNNPNVFNVINLEPGRPSIADNIADFGPSNRDMKLSQAGRFTRELHNRLVLCSHSDDVRSSSNELFLNSGSGLSKSISLLYQKLDEGNFCDSAWVNSEHLEPIKSKNALKSELPQESSEHELDDTESDETEFSIIEQGVETSEVDSLKLNQERTQTVDVPEVEVINVDEIIKDDELFFEKNTRCSSSCVNLPSTKVADRDPETLSASAVLDSLDPLWPSNGVLEQEHYVSGKSNYKAHKPLKKSNSLDDLTESVTSNFLNMLAMESGSFDSSCDGDPQSPREKLLRLFEKEALASGNLTLDFEANEEEWETDTHGLSSWDSAVDSDLSLIIQAAEEEHRMAQSLMHRRKAKMLEDLETDSLMQQWGINERDFENSPETWSGGFGSPIELPDEESPMLPNLPSIGQGLGSFVQTKNGGFLRSMNPSLFTNAKNGGSLIIQASNPVVLPSKMGNDLLEILLHMASDGIEELCNHINKLMPLQDITGKSITHMALDATTDRGASGRQGSWLPGLFEEFPHGYITHECMSLDSVSLEDIALVTISKIESLLIEGLRIQSGMSTDEAPSCIHPHYTKMHASGDRWANLRGLPGLEGVAKLQPKASGKCRNDVDGLMGLSMTLDEWSRLDSGIIEGDQNLEQVMKILKVHHSKISEFIEQGSKTAMDRAKLYGRKHGLLGNHITVAFVVQLRDPLRDYEPVGVQMLALTQVERVHVDTMQQELDDFLEIPEKETENEALLTDADNSPPRFGFKINEIHLSGVNNKARDTQLWGTTTQQQSGFRWLRAASMGDTAKHSSSKSKAIVRSYPQSTTKLLNQDILWSISHVHSNMKTENVHIRNPDIVFFQN